MVSRIVVRHIIMTLPLLVGGQNSKGGGWAQALDEDVVCREGEACSFNALQVQTEKVNKALGYSSSGLEADLSPLDNTDWNVELYMRQRYAEAALITQNPDTTNHLHMVETINWSVSTKNTTSGRGSTSYLGILVPDFFSKESYTPYTMAEFSFLLYWQADLDHRKTAFSTRTACAETSTLNGANYHDHMLQIAEEVNNPFGKTDTMSFVQGHSGSWKSDEFVGQLLGHSFIACMLETTARSGELLLDLSGDGTSTTPVQMMKRKAVAVVPSVLLKTRGYLQYGSSGLTVVKVEVEDASSGQWMSFDPSSQGTQWALAKMALVSEALYVMECYHTGMHLYSGAVVSAIKMSIPPASALGSIVAPSLLQVVYALFEQASDLHGDHESVFDGAVWPAANMTAVWALTQDFSRYYLDNMPIDILGMDGSSPLWWAGMASAFIEPISGFAATVASTISQQAPEILGDLQANLEGVGILTSASGLDVTTVAGLTSLLTNLLFVPGICHAQMYAWRESFTPLMGWVSTQEFLPYLTDNGKAALPLEGVLAAAFPTIPSTLAAWMQVAYDTAAGFDSLQPVPQLGDGPYNVHGDSETETELQQAIFNFQAGLNETRQTVYKTFGDFKNNTFVPGYFYPVEVPKPFGYAITQTTYV